MPPPLTQSTLPDNTALHLPPLSPSFKSHPQAANSAIPVVYALKLPHQIAETLQSAPANTTITFITETSGEIRIPNTRPIAFSLCPIADANSSTARATCYTRRDDSLRTVGPIIADLTIERKLASPSASTAKKRPLDSRAERKTGGLEVINDIPVHQPVKRQRYRRTAPVEKRPRAPARRPASLVSAPIPPTTKPTPPQSNGLVRPPRSVPTPPAAPPVSISPPQYRSPAVSPGYTNGRVNDMRKDAPGRSSFSGMQSRKVSPSPFPSSLPKPVPRNTPIKPKRYSPIDSSGPSSSVSSPDSPRTSAIRPPRVVELGDLRRQVVHFLALGEKNLSCIKERLASRRILEPHATLMTILYEVADLKQGVYRLKEGVWNEVSEEFDYSEGERSKMKVFRSEMVGPSGDGKTGKHGMSEEDLELGMERLRRETRDREVEKVNSAEEERMMRKEFMNNFCIYEELISRMEELRREFKELQTQYLSAQGRDEKETIARRISSNYGKHGSRHAKYERNLPLFHARLKRMRRALDDYAQTAKDRR